MLDLQPPSDRKNRCFGNHAGFYADYHDYEWGIEEHCDQKLFEMLILEGAQAGLSWETVLKKRSAYRCAFYDFDPSKVARMTDDELNNLWQHSDIIRNKLKIYSARRNAQVFLEIQNAYESFDRYVWGFVDNQPLVNDWASVSEIPAKTEISIALSKDLKKRGMNFVGPTIIYAFMQAVGMVNDHAKDCWLREAEVKGC